MVGRAPLWGTAADGQDGAALALDILKAEIDREMAYLGCRRVADITSNVLYKD